VSATVAEMLQATEVGLKVGPGWIRSETRHPLIYLVYTACDAGRQIVENRVLPWTTLSNAQGDWCCLINRIVKWYCEERMNA